MGPSMWTQLSRLPQPAPKRHTSLHKQPWACPEPGSQSQRLLLRQEGAGGGEAGLEVRRGEVGGELCGLHAQPWGLRLRCGMAAQERLGHRQRSLPLVTRGVKH